MKALNRKERDLISWDGNMWEELDKVPDMKPLNSAESALPVKVAFPSPMGVASSPPEVAAFTLPVFLALPPRSEEINPALSKETVMASPEAAVMQDHADSQDLPPPLLSACRSITRINSQQALKSEAQSVTREEGRYSERTELQLESPPGEAYNDPPSFSKIHLSPA